MKEKFAKITDRIAVWTGSPYTVAGVILSVVIWLAAGPFLGFSDSWQLLINTATTILTWILVHVLQSSQNRSDKATHTKLDTILRYIEAEEANKSIGIEGDTERSIDILHDDVKRG